MRIRQVALVARDLEPLVADLCAVLGIEVAYRDPGVGAFGLENAVMPVGDAFLEVVAPTRADTTAGRFLERRGGDAGYMVIIQSDDLEADRRRVEELGVRVVWETRFPDIATIHLHPRDVGGAILSLDVARPPESWRWAGPDWPSHVRTDVTSGITGVELRAADAADLACRWGQVLGQPARRTEVDHWEIALAGGGLRFDAAGDGADEGFVAFDVVCGRPRPHPGRREVPRSGTHRRRCAHRRRAHSPALSRGARTQADLCAAGTEMDPAAK